MVRAAWGIALVLGAVACGEKPAVEAPPPPASANTGVASPPPPKATELTTKPLVAAGATSGAEEQPVPVPPFRYADAKAAEGPSQAAGIDERLWTSFLQSAIAQADVTPWGIGETSKLRSPATRVALVKGLFPAIRAVAATPWFAAQYANERRARLHEEPRQKMHARSAGEIDATMIAQLQAAVAALEQAKTSAGLGPTQQAELDRAIDEQKKQIAALKSKPLGAEQAAREAEVEKQMETLDAAGAEERKAARAALEKRWPADPKQLVALRLAEVLELTKDVDFGAKTTKNKLGQARFVKDELEAKPRLWKAAYRAGKPTYEACRAFAQQWQDDLRAGKW